MNGWLYSLGEKNVWYHELHNDYFCTKRYELVFFLSLYHSLSDFCLMLVFCEIVCVQQEDDLA